MVWETVGVEHETKNNGNRQFRVKVPRHTVAHGSGLHTHLHKQRRTPSSREDDRMGFFFSSGAAGLEMEMLLQPFVKCKEKVDIT